MMIIGILFILLLAIVLVVIFMAIRHQEIELGKNLESYDFNDPIIEDFGDEEDPDEDDEEEDPEEDEEDNFDDDRGYEPDLYREWKDDQLIAQLEAEDEARGEG